MNNPIIQREFIGLLRTRRAIGAMILVAAALGALVYVRWPSEGLVDQEFSQSLQVLRVFGYGLTALVLLLAPVFPASAIVQEKQSGTLVLLLSAPLEAYHIVIGKMVGALGFILLLLLVSIPAAAACMAMGGISLTTQLLPLYGVLAVLALQLASVGLLISTYTRTSDSALRMTFVIVLVQAVVVLLPYQLLAAMLPDLYAQGLDYLRSISPIPALRKILGDTAVGSGGAIEQAPLVLRFLIFSAVITVFCLVKTTLRINQRMLDKPRASGKVTDERSAGVRAYRRVMYLWFFDPKRRSGLISSWANPVAVKERRSSALGRGHWIMRLAGICLIVSLGLMLAATNLSIDQGVEIMGGIAVLLQVSLIVLITPSLAAGMISGELESKSWQLLWMTPLKTSTIVIGKLTSVASTLSLILVATLPAYAVLVLIDPGQQSVVIRVLVSLLITAVTLLLLSAAVSSLFRKTVMATSVLYTIVIVLCGGTLLVWLGRDDIFSHTVVESILTVNPLAAALSLIGAPGFSQYDLVPLSWYFQGGLAVLSLIVLTVRTWMLSRPS